MRVLKFGGSSLATPDRVKDAGRIVLNSMNGTPAVVVVSAFQGVTNQLLDCARLAERRDPEYEQAYDRIAARHRSAIAAPGTDRHKLPAGYRVVKTSVLGGLHHEYRLVKEAA